MKKNLNSYLAGLLEGDGSFIVPKTNRDKKNRLRYAKVKTVFHLKDRPLAELLKNRFGGNFEVHENYLVWNITDLENLRLMCNTINGYLRTPKIHRFHRLIDYINQRSTNVSEIKKLELDKSSIESNAWLAGFSDADANFHIMITKRKGGKKRVHIHYRLELQRFYTIKFEDLDDSEVVYSFYDVCEKISAFLKAGFYSRSRDSYQSVMVISHNVVSHAQLISYFDKFPLFSSKFLDYKDWKTIYELQCQKLHRTPSGIAACEKIKARFNSKRSQFSWSHLKTFYSNS